MISFPNCKINFGLRVLEKRKDGFHNIDTILIPVPWFDVLEVVKSEELSFQANGISIDESKKENLVVQAYRMLKRDFSLPPVNLFLLKNIPVGAGLGGGSADAAFAIKLLNEKFDLQISAQKQKKYAAKIGSDCAFFIDNKTGKATGRGEVMEEISFSLKGFHLLILKPEININTAEAYSWLDDYRTQNIFSFAKKSLTDLVKLPPNYWKQNVVNDFEDVVFLRHPKLKKIKEQLYQCHATFALMSGSGSSFFALFENETQLNLAKKKFASLKLFTHYF